MSSGCETTRMPDSDLKLSWEIDIDSDFFGRAYNAGAALILTDDMGSFVSCNIVGQCK